RNFAVRNHRLMSAPSLDLERPGARSSACEQSSTSGARGDLLHEQPPRRVGGLQGDLEVAPEVMSPVHCADLLGRVPRTYRIVSRSMAAYYVGFSLIWFGSIVGFVMIVNLARDCTAARVGGLLVAVLVVLITSLV